MGAYLQVLEGMCDCGMLFLVALCMVVVIYAGSFINGSGTSAILLFLAIMCKHLLKIQDCMDYIAFTSTLKCSFLPLWWWL